MTYDPQNRVTKKTYSQSTPEATYTWDTGTGCLKGMLCAVATAKSTTAYGYNVLGQTASVIQTTSDATGSPATYGSTIYTYDLQGNVKSIKYPSGDVVSYALSGAGRATNAAVGGANYASSITYAPHGAMRSVTMGNSVQEAVTFDPRLRAQTVTAALGGTQLLSVTNAYANNSNVSTQAVAIPGAPVYTQTYGYDGANRLTGVSEKNAGSTATTWQQNYGYDGYGNRAVTYTSFNEDVSAPTNRLS